MPKMENIIDSMTQNSNEPDSSHSANYSSLDLQYAYSRVNLHPDTACHCNFIITSGESTPSFLSVKTAAILSLSPPTNLKKTHHINKFIPNIASLCHLFKTLLEKGKFFWNIMMTKDATLKKVRE